MKYKINNEEREVLEQFKELRIPPIFKTDDTDYILFVEEVDFTVCEKLLKGEEITSALYEWIVADINNGHCPCFNDFVKVIDKFYVDEYTKSYCDKIMQVMEILKKYKTQK